MQEYSPLKALDLSHALLLELQRIKDAVIGIEGLLGHHLKQLMQTLIVRLLKTHLFLLFQKLGGPGALLVPLYQIQHCIGKIGRQEETPPKYLDDIINVLSAHILKTDQKFNKGAKLAAYHSGSIEFQCIKPIEYSNLIQKFNQYPIALDDEH